MKYFIIILIIFISGVTLACANRVKTIEVDYQNLISLMKENAQTELCYWNLYIVRPEDDFFHIDYYCSPSVNYNGSRIVVKIRTRIKKELIGINKDGGKIIISDIKQK